MKTSEKKAKETATKSLKDIDYMSDDVMLPSARYDKGEVMIKGTNT